LGFANDEWSRSARPSDEAGDGDRRPDAADAETPREGIGMKRLRAVMLAAPLVIALVTTTGAHGEASQEPRTELRKADTTPPSLVLEPYPRYRLGSQIDVDYEESYWGADFRLQWKASDQSGICSQYVEWSAQDGTMDYPLTAKARIFDFFTEVYNYDPGPDVFWVHSTDCAGNTATSTRSVSRFGLREDDAPGITYKGTWSVSNFKGFSGGTTHYSTKAGDSFTTTFTGDGPVALVMEKAANRGSADVYVDGVFRKTINTNASTTKHRVVVWQGIYKLGTHTLRVVNRGTPGHPRIDLDAVLLCPGSDSGWTCDR
jgi:hypothetical protein